MKRILVIRGGAIGDFILTLPALKALRDAHPGAVIELLAYKHIALLVENRFYANAVRSIESGPLSRFFARGAELPQDLQDYFASFDLVVSYLFDPDNIFAANLRRAGAQNVVIGPATIRPGSHAARQLAAPIEQLGIPVADLAPTIFLSEEDRQFARQFCAGKKTLIALHPGSGSERKNWPLQHWIALGNDLLDRGERLLVVSGEADEKQAAQLEAAWGERDVQFARNLPLPHLAALLQQARFIGHDSGISHLAAAAGARCMLLFGPTDPAVWAPQNEKACIIRAPKNDLALLKPDVVKQHLPPGQS